MVSPYAFQGKPITTKPITASSSFLHRSRCMQPVRSCKSRYRSNRITCLVFILVIGLLTTAVRHVPTAAYAAPRPSSSEIDASSSSSSSSKATPSFHIPRVVSETSQSAKTSANSSFPTTASSSRVRNNGGGETNSQKSLYKKAETDSATPPRKLKYPPRRDSKQALPEPAECSLWRQIAKQPSKLKLYRKHFNSLDVIDWFLYTAAFGEHWHSLQKRRPTYVDIAANHARRWSATWFFDRCMGWDGVCAEPNDIYWGELKTERHCRLIDTCLSDRVHNVNFSFTAAYGGVVADRRVKESSDGERYGVNASLHTGVNKYGKHHTGIREITCTTVDRALQKRNEGTVERKSHFDFMTLDVEGHEFPILKGVDWNRTVIDIIVTENRGAEVRELLFAQGYDEYAKLLKDDVWIRRGSEIELDPVVVKWMESFDREKYEFGPEAVDEAWDVSR